MIVSEAGVKVDGGGTTVSRAWGRGRWLCDNVNDLRKRTTMTRFEAEVEAVAPSEAGVKEAVCSEAGLEVAVCFEARDEAAACSGSGIEDGRQR
jgi:hypothetical protein